MKKQNILAPLSITLWFLLIFNPCSLKAQKVIPHDTSYYVTYPNTVTARIYLIQKFVPFTISAPSNNKDLNYKTNSKLDLGIGATYRNLTLNLSYGFKFLNKDKGQGTTNGLDFQFHLYPHKWAIDLLGTFIKGYYLDPKDNNGLNLVNKYYLRPDFKRDVIGFSVFRVPNANRFSYRAALIQNDWQTKSAGSLLFGGEAYYGIINGDSALVPSQVSNNFPQKDITKINFFSIGPGIGYAYTLVIDKSFFISASAIGSLDVNFSTEETTNDKHSKVSLLPGGVYKGAIGYNSSTWSISANITGNALYAGSAFSSKEYFLPTGNLRLILAKKIGLKTH